MTDGSGPGTPSRADRFDLAVQGNRARAYALATSVASTFRALHLIETRWTLILAIGGTATVTALVVWWLVRSGWHRRLLGRAYDPLWILLDVGFISATIAVTGGATSPWQPWYVAIFSAAVFVAGQRAAFFTFLASIGGYLAALSFAGNLGGPGQPVLRGIALMVSLYAATFFFLRGVSMLQDKRREVSGMRDESRRKVEELTRLTATLEERTRELHEANLRLRESDRLKSQFLANVSHELRTPLNSIIGFSEILQTRLVQQLDERQARFLGYIHAGGEQLLAIINDILDLSKIEAGQAELACERLPLRAAVDGVSTVLRSTAEKKGIRVRVEAAADVPLIEADPARLKQVLYHLLSNAIKFSYPESEVRVKLQREAAVQSPLRRNAVSIAVVDDGIGIEPHDRELIFEAFRQADGSASREFQGAGLGLALVRRFVELHGGVVTVDSAVGQGSTFTVHLPLQQKSGGPLPPGGVETEAELRAPEPGEDRVLVVEDDPTVYDVIARHLNDGGWVPVRARTGDDALKLARGVRPAAVTLDLVIPGIDGLGVLRALRADPETRHIPVIIISVLDNRELGLTLGADDYFVKPVDRDALLDRLGALVPREVGGRVLVIDDDPALHELVAAGLPERYRLLHAHTGRDGVELARNECPDLVLLDLMMEGMDGFEVAATLKGDERTRTLPIVVLTAKEMDRDDRERLHGKIEALVHKTDCSPARLEAVLRDVVRRQLRMARTADV
ncbi:MAG TPA: response regulator [Thermoanaerobaculia bacterium]|jgi:signal transduction histidine kinase/DNA-binding response OmpR family regulator|nr:response regulator [Thermoanaerobaculia bacterium]